MAKDKATNEDPNKLYPDYDAGVSTPTAYEAGAGQLPPGSPYQQDVENRKEADRLIAEQTAAENQRVWDDRPEAPNAEALAQSPSGSGPNGGAKSSLNK